MQAMDCYSLKCEGSKHIKEADLVCLFCNKIICARCFKEHKVHSNRIMEIDEVMEEVYQSFDVIQDKMGDYRKKLGDVKDDSKVSFDNEVKTQYEQELDNISNYFRKIHDLFHTREVKLKDTLLGFSEKNKDTFKEYNEQVENDVKDSKDLIQSLSDLPTPSSYQQNKPSYTKDFKIDLIKKHIKANKILETLKKDQDDEEKQQKLNKLQLASGQSYYFKNDRRYNQYILHEPFTTVEVINGSMEIVNSEKLVQSVYIYGDAFQKINLGKKSIETLELKGSKFDQSRSIFKSMVCTQDKIYIFRRKEYLIYDPTNGTWTIKQFGGYTDCGDWISAQYDGNKSIYLFGGCNGATNHRSIHKFNIETNFLELNIAQTRIPIRFQTTCLENERYIYTVDGVQGNYEKESILERFDTQTRTLTVLKDLVPLGYSDVVGMCYVEHKESIFMYCQNQSLIQYNLKTDEITPKTTKNFGSSQCYVFLHYDGKNTIYCVTKNDCAQYNILSDSWTSINVGVLHPYELHEYAMCFTDKF